MSLKALSKITLLFIPLCFFHLGESIEDFEKARFETIVSGCIKKIPQVNKVWLEQQDLSADQIKTHQRCYRAIFAKISAISKYVKKPALVGALAKNREKNLHPLVLPYDETRTLRHKKGFYISANDVITPERSYIVAQAPSEGTLGDFWTTILETNTRCVVALAMPKVGRRHFVPYWEQDSFPQHINDWEISLIERKTIATSFTNPDQCLVQRRLHVKKRNNEHDITHIHYENWPDMRAPASDLFQELLSLLNNQNSSPILVHCSAGIGRAGTVVTADSLLREAKKLTTPSLFQFNIPKRIVELRMQRKGLVSTQAQMKAIYCAIAKAMETKAFRDA